MENKTIDIVTYLENNYFSVRFQDENEYLGAIPGGPWTIFGNYFMVRPWTPSFSIYQAQHNSLLVCVRLPGLPEGIYNASLLKFIGGAIG